MCLRLSFHRNIAGPGTIASVHGITLSDMTLLLIGIGLLGAVLGLYYLKDRLENRTLARIAYSDLIMRFTVIAIALIVAGLLLALGKLLS